MALIIFAFCTSCRVPDEEGEGEYLHDFGTQVRARVTGFSKGISDLVTTEKLVLKANECVLVVQ